MTDRSEDSPRVSAIIPCFNGELFIGDAIRSVLDQTYGNVEVIVVDDGSTDGSRAVIRSFLHDGGVTLVAHESNRGIPAARNTGISSSSGEFVSFLDQDDYWVPEKLARQIAVFQRSSPDVGIVFSDVLMVDDDGLSQGLLHGNAIPRGIDHMSREDLIRAFFVHNFVPLISVLVRRTCLDEVGWFDESILGGMDDNELCFRLVSACGMRVISEPLAVHRLHTRNYSSDTERLIADSPRISELMLSRYPHLSELLPRKLAKEHARIARYHRDRGDLTRARAELRKAIAADRSWYLPYASFPICCMGRLGLRLISFHRRMRRALLSRRANRSDRS